LLYQTDWVSLFVGWSLFPVLVFYLHRTVRDADGESIWMAGARLGLLAGIWILNAHSGYLASLALVLAVYALVLSPVRARVYSCLLLAFTLAAAVSAERIWFAASEMQGFPGTLLRATQDGYTLAQHLQAAFVPLIDYPPNPRGPFLGLVIGVAALGLVS